MKLFSAKAIKKATTDNIVSITVHVLKVSFTLSPKYSFTIQKPASLTCDNINDPAPVAITNSSKFTPDKF